MPLPPKCQVTRTEMNRHTYAQY